MLGEKGSDLRQVKTEKTHFNLSYKVMLGFVCTFCAMWLIIYKNMPILFYPGEFNKDIEESRKSPIKEKRDTKKLKLLLKTPHLNRKYCKQYWGKLNREPYKYLFCAWTELHENIW